MILAWIEGLGDLFDGVVNDNPGTQSSQYGPFELCFGAINWPCRLSVQVTITIKG